MDVAEKRPRGPYAKSTERRAEIIDSATAVFSEHGYRGGSLRQIAKQLDVSINTLMHHFPSKVALLAAVLDQKDASDPDFEMRSRRDGFIPTVLRNVEQNTERRELIRMFSIVSAEATAPGHEAHDWLKRRYAAVSDSYTDLIRFDRAAARIGGNLPADVSAGLVISGWEGIQIRWLADGADPVSAMSALLTALFEPPAAPDRHGGPASPR